jgi:hypothetical protein
MSTAIAKNFQVGTSGTPADNFTIFQPATPDGTLRIGNGNTGITTGLVTLNSAGNLGIGTSSPSAKLTVNDANGIPIRIGDISAAPVSQTAVYVGASTSALSGGNGDLVLIPRSSDARSILFYTGSGTAAERMRLDSSGNLGLGVTPSAWNSAYRALDIGNAFGLIGAGGAADLYANAFLNSGGSFIYKTTAAAAAYSMAAGAHRWYTAPSGTAGNAMSFTQAMTLDASGNLLVGTTANSGHRLQVVSAPGTVQMRWSDATNSTGYMDTVSGASRIYTNTNLVFATGDPSTSVTERARIDSSGNLLVGKTSTGANILGAEMRNNGQVFSAVTGSTNSESTYEAYSTGAGNFRFYIGMAGTVFATSTTISAISDQRLKENVEDIDVGLDAVMALKPRKFDWKEGKGKNIKGDRGWIAQEFEQVFPDMIDTWKDEAPEGEEPYKSVRADLIPVLVKAIQELKAEFDAYKASHP